MPDDKKAKKAETKKEAGAAASADKTTEPEKGEWLENVIAFAVVALLVLGVCAYIFHWFPFNQAAAQVSIPDQIFPVTDGANPALGNDTANVTMIEFADYQCSACAAFQRDTFPQIKRDYIDTGKIRYVFRDFPLEQIHPYADEAALAAACAEEQGEFWQFHDALYNISDKLSDPAIKALAPQLGLNDSQFEECLSSGRYLDKVRADYVDGINDGGVTATPTFFIGGKRIIGGQPYATFQQAIDAALEAKK